jgi:uncharacterized protein (DUF2252 family)
MRHIVDSTGAFERWMKRRADISARLLDKKHRKMAEGPFPFLRATLYRWVEQWPKICRQLARRDDDVLLAVGDLHVENFGVWKNSLGDHVWGVNDFDDACELPFTSDLVRLAASVVLAAEQQQVKTSPEAICEWLLTGYRSGLRRKVDHSWSGSTKSCAFSRRTPPKIRVSSGGRSSTSRKPWTGRTCPRVSRQCSRRPFRAAPG